MMISSLLLSAALTSTPIPPVPGLCTEPAAENVGKPGCFLAARIPIEAAPAQVYWLIHEAASEKDAIDLAKAHRWSTVVKSHGRDWVLAVEESVPALKADTLKAVVGPIALTAGQKLDVRFLESWFPPGMQTRVHAHPGPEAFYVIDGEQCVESPDDKQRIGPGGHYIIEGGVHHQSAPNGRRNLVAVFVPENQPWIQIRNDWTPSNFCDG